MLDSRRPCQAYGSREHRIGWTPWPHWAFRGDLPPEIEVARGNQGPYLFGGAPGPPGPGSDAWTTNEMPPRSRLRMDALPNEVNDRRRISTPTRSSRYG